MPYKLKATAETFRVVDGPYAGRDFQPGIIYDDIPPQEAGKFEEAVDTDSPDKKNKSKTEKGGK